MTKKCELLDEKGFVFIGEDKKPYLCRMFSKRPTLFWWHPDKKWVSMASVTQEQIWRMPRNLTQEQQDIYNKKHEENM